MFLKKNMFFSTLHVHAVYFFKIQISMNFASFYFSFSFFDMKID